MRVFTTYFAKLRKLDNKITPVSIARYTPKWYTGKTCKMLAPSAETLMGYKDSGDWKIFQNKYLEELGRLDPNEVNDELKKLSGSKDIALVCFEKEYFECHRSICAKWLNDSLGIRVRELNL